MPEFITSAAPSHCALLPHSTPQPSSTSMHEIACKCTVSAKCNFLPAHLNTRAPTPISAKRTHLPKWHSLFFLSLLFLLPHRAPAQNEPTQNAKPNLILI